MPAARSLSPAPWRLLALAALLSLLAALTGCAGLPEQVARTPSSALTAPPQAPLPSLVHGLGIPPGLSALRPMPLPQDALAARLALIAQARTAIDLQTYHVADDTTGRTVLRALRDAAARGVRVRLLLDDLHTAGLDDLLLGLAAQPGVEVRLFNPFTGLRRWTLGRLVQLAGDFGRLNHRMHNKLLVVDGAMAIAGGRNLADEYFLRHPQANFIDFDLLAGGALVPVLAAHFDDYWNSERAIPLGLVANNGLGPGEQQAWFELATAPTDPPLPPVPMAVLPTSSSAADPTSAAALLPPRPTPERGHFGFYIAPAGSRADPPDKRRSGRDTPDDDTVAAQLISFLGRARQEVIMVTPYFVPGRIGMEHIRALRSRGVELRLVTNATGSSDEPVVSLGYERHRVEMLRLGLHLYEVSSTRLQRDETLRAALGSSVGRLHAKMGFIDRRHLFTGSLNLDARSALINTEVGLRVDSAPMVQQLLAFYRIESQMGVYQLRLKPDGRSIEWVSRGGPAGQAEEAEDSDPDDGPWLRFKLWLWSLVVPEELL